MRGHSRDGSDPGAGLGPGEGDLVPGGAGEAGNVLCDHLLHHVGGLSLYAGLGHCHRDGLGPKHSDIFFENFCLCIFLLKLLLLSLRDTFHYFNISSKRFRKSYYSSCFVHSFIFKII